MKNKKSLVVGALVMALLVVSIGYAAIATISLVVSGSATATVNSENFKVKFTGNTNVSDDGKVTAGITNDTTATIAVQGLTAKGDTVTATYEITNDSVDIIAGLEASVAQNTNGDYFEVTPSLSANSIGPGNNSTLTVQVKCIKTPINEAVSSQIKVNVAATAN